MFSYKNDFKIMGIIFSLTLILQGCGSSGGGGGTPPTPPPESSAETAAKASSSTTKGAEVGTGLSDIASSLGEAIALRPFGLSKPVSPVAQKTAEYNKIAAINAKIAKSKVMQKAVTYGKSLKTFQVGEGPSPCTDGGTVSFTVGASSPPSFSFQIKFGDCRENGTQINGPASITGSDTRNDNATLDISLSLGNEDEELEIQIYQEIAGNAYGSLDSIFRSKMDMGFKVILKDIRTHEISAHGMATYDDFSEKTEIVFDNFKNVETFENGLELPKTSFAPAPGEDHYTSTLNGKVSQTQSRDDGVHTIELSFTEFFIETLETSTPTGYTKDVSYSGTFSINFTPDEDCGTEGTYTIETLTPLHYISGEYCPIAGQLNVDIPGQDSAEVIINSDTSIAVSSGDVTTTFEDCRAFEALCGFEDFQVNSVSTGGNPGTAVSGGELSVTLTWVDTPSQTQDSDMDLHVGYYTDANPTAGPANAVIAFHTVEDPAVLDSVSFGSATAILDFDDTEGLGPEHVTVDGLPAGYYMIAINSYDLGSATSTKINTTVTIGGQVFTFLDHDFTTGNQDGATSDAWYRVTDLRCETPGNCEFVSPNLALNVHDDSNFFKTGSKKKQ